MEAVRYHGYGSCRDLVRHQVPLQLDLIGSFSTGFIHVDDLVPIAIHQPQRDSFLDVILRPEERVTQNIDYVDPSCIITLQTKSFVLAGLSSVVS